MIEIPGKYTTAQVHVDAAESDLVAQLTSMVNHPAFTEPVAIMPDTHVGKGCVIGFSMRLTDKVVPNVVGVDIGCGMLCVRLQGLPESVSLLEIDKCIRAAVPMGFQIHERPVLGIDKWAFTDAQDMVGRLAKALGERNVPLMGVGWLRELCKRIGADVSKVACAVGTLGGGNHFIELGQDQDGAHWLIIHSGSRNFGLKVCNYHQKLAVRAYKQLVEHDYQAELARLKETCSKKELAGAIVKLKDRMGIARVGRGLEYLEGTERLQYLYDMVFAQWYASWNRRAMLAAIRKAVPLLVAGEVIETIHNYIDPTDLVIRKGAVRARAGEKLIIPLNMRDGTLVCIGKGNADWNCTAPHGAGRVLSRSQAKAKLALDEFRRDMDGIASSSVCKATLDEAPRAYKDSAMIEAAIAPTAKVVGKIKPLLNLKATT